MNQGGLLSIEPQELKFQFEVKKQISTTLQLSNKIDNYVAFKVKTTNPKKYSVRPNAGIVLPRSTSDIIVTMQAQKEIPAELQSKDKFLLQNVAVPNGTTAKDITPEMFSKEAGNNVEECKLRVVYVIPQRSSPIPEGSDEGSSHKVSASDNGNSTGLASVTRAYPESHEKSYEKAAMDRRMLSREEETSRIEQLPDELLCLILSFLPTLVEKARTSILSHRWRNLWHTVTCLDFDASKVLPHERLRKSHEWLQKSHDWYISWVNKVIEARVAMMPRSPLVRELRISYGFIGLAKTDQCHIDRWVYFGIANQVEKLHLQLSTFTEDRQYTLSEELWYRAPSGLANLKCLKSVFLSCVNVSNQFIKFVLLSCPLLEDFSLHHVGTLNHMDVSGTPPLQLRRLELYLGKELALTKLCAPHLTSFYCNSILLNPQKIDVPMLTDLTVGGYSPSVHIMKYLEHFWTCLPQLEKLELIMYANEEFSFEEMPKLLNLKYLKMVVRWDTNYIFYQIVEFIEACPLLETFVLEIAGGLIITSSWLIKEDDTKRKWRLKLEKKCREEGSSFKCLKVLKLFGGDGKTIDQEIVKCIIRKAPHLEKLFVHTKGEQDMLNHYSSKPEMLRIVEAKAKELCRRSTQNIEITITG